MARLSVRTDRLYWCLLPSVILLGIFFVYPILTMAKASVFDPYPTAVHFLKFLSGNLYWRILFNTVLVSLTTAGICAVVGYPAAYFLAHCDPRRRPYYIFLILIPLWVSILIRSYSWMVLLGREGLLNVLFQSVGLTSEPVQMLYTTGAVYLAMVQIMLPIMILTCYSVMSEIQHDIVRAARVLGAGRWNAFRHVYFPLSLPGVRNGSIIIFILSMGYFITPALVGGRKDMMIGNLIVFQINKLADWDFASAIGVVLLAVTLLVSVAMKKVIEWMSPYANEKN
jgi:ABC-type spermidine/putrescine transport system permease subunit I